MRSSILADSSAISKYSGHCADPRWFKALHANRIVSRSYCPDSFKGAKPFRPGCLRDRSISILSLCSSAACARLRRIYGHIDSIAAVIALFFKTQRRAGDAFGCFGLVGLPTYPPAISWATKGKISSVVVMAMRASQLTYPAALTLLIMYDPSPSSKPAKYAASMSFMTQPYHGPVTNPEYRSV